MSLMNTSSSKKIKGTYHCPYSGCLYNGSEKSFSGKKFLNQHIVKVHAEKKYFCEKCSKGFGLDWWRKHHQKTCGIEWICGCGSKYTSRESLLTHARRNFHELPDHILHTDKAKQRKKPIENKEKPIIFVIQPIIQNINCNQNESQNSARNQRLILPKDAPCQILVPTPKSDNLSPSNIKMSPTSPLNIETNFTNNLSIPYSEIIPIQNVSVPHLFNYSSDSNTIKSQKVASTQTTCDSNSVFASSENNLKFTQVTTGTQTSNELDHNIKTRESRASQCNRRKSKLSSSVGNESIHTQTAESAVVKIKRKRSRRKSVAITTEPNLFPTQKQLKPSVWPDFKDLLFQNPEVSNNPSFKSTMSTQTNYYNKVFCDSQTITDEELFKFDWTGSPKKDFESDICKSAFIMPIIVPSVDPLTVLQDSIVCNNLSEFELFSSNSILKGANNANVKHDIIGQTPENGLESEDCSIFNMFPDCSNAKGSNQIPQPVLSDIYTQTATDSEFDFSLLANMETQTTDDIPLYDLLEFSDTETQTPWDDFPDIDDTALTPDQLSIEIQTDFSSLNAELNPDPYAFFNGAYVQSMIEDCVDKEKSSVNIETQTQEKFSFPQLTNSESQTLDISHFI